MTELDQFESMFKAAAKEVFHLDAIALSKILIVTDLDRDEAERFVNEMKTFLQVIGAREDSVEWSVCHDDDYGSLNSLRDKVVQEAPDLVCTYRNLRNREYEHAYSLGAYLNALIRLVKPPVLVVPHPKRPRGYAWTGKNTDRVMVVTDHLAGDERIANWGIRFTEDGGKVFLTHIEDEDTFRRYIDVIAKIPSLNTDEAREKILAQLLKEPNDYIAQIQKKIAEAKVPISAEAIVQTGRRVADYKELVEGHQADLLVMRSHDDDHDLALHGVAYTLTVELSDLPILLL